ncbi:hypothetical protein [Streptomyces sp. NPDC093261]|uniref:hypothetical protein n=1 Tax=Streptomyces sp. NPDC093261 TaxID=3366037 RepID=UPI0037FEA7D1
MEPHRVSPSAATPGRVVRGGIDKRVSLVPLAVQALEAYLAEHGNPGRRRSVACCFIGSDR